MTFDTDLLSDGIICMFVPINLLSLSEILSSYLLHKIKHMSGLLGMLILGILTSGTIKITLLTAHMKPVLFGSDLDHTDLLI